MRSLSVLLALALAGSGVARAQVHLAYRCVAGSVLRQTIENDFQLPIVGAQPGRLAVTTTVRATGAAGSQLGQSVRRSAPGKEDRTVDVDLTVSARGEVSDPTPVPADGEGAFLARTTLLLLPGLPDRSVDVGATWTTDRVFPLPPLPVSAPSAVQVRTTYRLTGLRTDAGQRIAEVAMDGVQRAGEKLGLSFTGKLEIDAASGRPLTGELSGKATIPVAPFLPSLTATFKIRLLETTVQLPGRAPRTAAVRISLLGI